MLLSADGVCADAPFEKLLDNVDFPKAVLMKNS